MRVIEPRAHSTLHRHFGFLKQSLGRVSYAQIPAQFKSIFGVTGSLGVLSEKQRGVLERRYKCSQYSYFPSFWGKRELAWNEMALGEDDFQVLESEIEVFNQALVQIKKIVKSERAVLVFLKDSEMLDRFRNHIAGNVADLRLIDPKDSHLDDIAHREGRKEVGAEGKRGREWTKKEYIIDVQAGEPRTVTLATEAYSRGEDFKYSPSVLAKGGGHAIQCYLSKTNADEVQVRGRVARKNEPGSYSLFVHWGDVRATINKSNTVLSDLENEHIKALKGDDAGDARKKTPTELYRDIKEERLKEAEARFEKQCTRADRLLVAHNRTMELTQYTRQFFNGSTTRSNVLDALAKLAD